VAKFSSVILSLAPLLSKYDLALAPSDSTYSNDERSRVTIPPGYDNENKKKKTNLHKAIKR
jgi:hypothetical protein